MKKWKFVLLLILLPATYVVADQLDDFIAHLEKYKADIDANYYNVLDSKLKYVVHRHFSFAALDHKATSVGLVQLAYTDLEKIQKINQRFEVLRLQMSESPEKIDAIAAELFTLMGEAQAYKYRADLFHKDIQLLANSWGNYCHSQRLDQLTKFFDPRGNFTPNGDLGFVSAPAIPYEFGIQVSLNENGGVSHYQANGGVSNENQNDKELKEGLWTGAAVAAGVICSPGVILSMVCMGAVYAVKFLVDTITLGIKNQEVFDKENKQSDLLREIYLSQFNAIQRLAPSVRSVVTSSCQANFPASDEWNKPVFENQLAVSTQAYNTLHTYLNGEFKEIQQDRYKYLLEQYFPKVLESYLKNIQAYFIQKVELNKKISDYTKDSVGPALKKTKTSKGAIADAISRQALWDRLIVGDSHYREDKGFGFTEEGQKQNSFPNRWDEISRQVLKEALK